MEFFVFVSDFFNSILLPFRSFSLDFSGIDVSFLDCFFVFLGILMVIFIFSKGVTS